MEFKGFLPTEEDLIFEKIFNDYLFDKVSDVEELHTYSFSQKVEVANILLLFLKEEMLRGNCFNNFKDLQSYFVSDLFKESRFYEGFLLLLDLETPQKMNRLRQASILLQDIGLGVNEIYIDINILSQKYILERVVLNKVLCSNKINKV